MTAGRRKAATALLALGVLMGACTDDGEPVRTAEPPTATEAPTEAVTPDLVTCPAQAAVCDFSLRLADAIARADFEALRGMMQPSEYTCPGPTPGGLGGPYPLCDGAGSGESRSGMRVYYLNSHGTVAAEPLVEVRQAILSGWQFEERLGSEQPRIVGLHCPVAGTGASCDELFVLVLAGAPHFEVSRGAAGYAITALQFSHFAENGSVFDTGGDFAMSGASGVREAHFYPWRPSSGRDGDAVRRDWLMAPAEISGVVVTPHEGSCPTTLTLRVPEAALVQEPKGAEIVEVDLFDGPVAIDYQTNERSRPREVVQAALGAVEQEFEIQINSSMLDGRMCSVEMVGMVVHGSAGPKVAGYRVVP